MKQIVKILLCLVLIVGLCQTLLPTKANASYVEATEGYFTYSYWSKGEYYGASITAVDPSVSGYVKVPSTLGGVPVTRIGYGAFKNCWRITDVILPNGITEIGDNAFYGCDSLKEIVIPEGVIKIGSSAFESCDNLRKISLPSSLEEIGWRAFRYSGLVEFYYAGTEEQKGGIVYRGAAWEDRKEELQLDWWECGTRLTPKPQPVISATVSGPSSVNKNETAEITVRLSSTPTMDSAKVQIQLEDGLSLVSASWLASGTNTNFDMSTNIGVLNCSKFQTLNGTVFTFTIKGIAPSAALQKVKVNFTFMNGSLRVGAATAENFVTVTCNHDYGDWTKLDDNQHGKTCSICNDVQSEMRRDGILPFRHTK